MGERMLFKRSVAFLTSTAFMTSLSFGANQKPIVRAYANTVEVAVDQFNSNLVDVELKGTPLFQSENVFSDSDWIGLKPLMINAQRSGVRLAADDLAFIVVAEDGSHQARVSSSGNGKFLLEFNDKIAVYTPSGDPNADIKNLEAFFTIESKGIDASEKVSGLNRFINEMLNSIIPQAHAISSGVVAAIVITVAVVAAIYYITKKTTNEIKKTGETTRASIVSTTRRVNRVLDESADAIRENKQNLSDATRNLKDTTQNLKDASQTIRDRAGEVHTGY